MGRMGDRGRDRVKGGYINISICSTTTILIVLSCSGVDTICTPLVLKFFIKEDAGIPSNPTLTCEASLAFRMDHN